MSNYEDDFEETDDQQESNPVRARMKQLEKETRDLRKQLAEAETARREFNFMKAGIDPTEAKFKYFVKGYDGDLSPEAIRQAAVEAQLITPEKTVVDTDKDTWQQSNKVATGSETSSVLPSWTKRITEANSPDEVFAIFAEAQAQGIDLSSEN